MFKQLEYGLLVSFFAKVFFAKTNQKLFLKICLGLAGSALVEAPHVVNGVITAWDVIYAPKRRFAVDMAGFAVNLKLILSTK